MALISLSPSSQPNRALVLDEPEKSESNKKWLARIGDSDGLILLGGSSVADFRVRVAQSSLRRDMLPSFWSQVGILLGSNMFATVPLDLASRDPAPASKRADDVSAIPRHNGVRMCSLDEIDNAQRFPNIAVIRFAKVHDNVRAHIDRVSADRSIVDIPALMLHWLGFAWGTAGSSNPLLSGIGLPSSAFVETVFAMAGFELTPGLSAASSCPEAIWQSAKWWTGFYEKTAADTSQDKKAAAVSMVPTGSFYLRQPSAAVNWPPYVRAAEAPPDKGASPPAAAR